VGVKARAQPLPGHQISIEQQHGMSVDGLLPTKSMHPSDAEDAARELRLCELARASVVVWGGGTQMQLGSEPRGYDVAFSTERMTRLLEYEPADLTCRVEAGMRVADLQATLEANGQRLPLDPPHPDHATVGGMVAANTNGLNRARHGTVRDWVIGMAVAYPSGKVARAGGKVVKNVAGYDLMKLHTGALGTLGVIVEVNFKVQTRPEADVTLLGHFRGPVGRAEGGHRPGAPLSGPRRHDPRRPRHALEMRVDGRLALDAGDEARRVRPRDPTPPRRRRPPSCAARAAASKGRPCRPPFGITPGTGRRPPRTRTSSSPA